MRDQIITGDALTVLRGLPAGVVDVGVTSPPYNKQENKKGWLVRDVKYQGAGDKKEEGAYQAEQVAVLDEVYRLTRAGGSFFYNHKLRWEQGELLHPMQWLGRTRWTIRQELIWDRVIAANIRGWRFWQVEERIYWLYKPVDGHKIGAELASRHALMTSIWRFPPEEKNPHPAPFPLTLPLRALYSVLDARKGALVLDPYCGSGSTCVAAALLGQHYLGVDVSAAYVRQARERLARAETERPLAEQEVARHRVRSTFAQKKQQGRHVGRFAPPQAQQDAMFPA